ncbi:MAG: OmpA family protein [Rhodobacteraceae bacterium]|nr:OmpA family protein [Paracoccaceae bacterium]
MAAAAEVEEEEGGDEDCPKCPPVGAPAWMATFADMATLLMAFFVLILSFAEFNTPKFKQISGSLNNAFGVQRVVPVVEQPKGTTVISLEFSPSPSPSVTNQMTQQTTEQELPQVEVKTKSEDAVSGDNQATDGQTEGQGGQQASTGEQATSGQAMSGDQLASALKDAIQSGEVQVDMAGENVVINFPSEDTTQKDLPSLVQETLAALAEARQASGQADQEVLFGGLEQELAQLAAAANEAATNQGQSSTPSDAAAQAQAQAAEQAAGVAENQLQAALENELQQGLVKVERREGTIMVTVGAGGAFPSGNADMTGQAREIMNKIAAVSMGAGSSITVSGHTDDVPIATSTYRDNWDLAAARASSVVQAIQDTGMVTSTRMKAVSYGETQPVAPNTTAEGREENRRIEIEIDFGQGN